ncbi:unnamed protein product, partial [Ectocarpus fasciculatus]
RAASKKGNAAKGEKENKYSSTLNLPTTSFNQRANSQVREPELQKWWEENKIYETLYESNNGPNFTIHDGPPYANGDLHIGHALNKILKDMINRYSMLQGKRVTYIPGWDCHGLPIEMKVLQSLKPVEKKSLTPIQIREKAAGFAEETIQNQMKSFRRYGVWAHWDEYYSTKQPEYEAAQIRVFAEMFHKGYIYRGRKPVHWSPSSRTALAEAELEYPDNHVSKSIYLAFPVTTKSAALEMRSSALSDRKLYLAVWTTTPWTIPANQAIAVNATVEYSIVHHPKIMNDELILVAKELISALEEKVGLTGETAGERFCVLDPENPLSGAELIDTLYSHPLSGNICPVIVGGDYINTESGTALVHTAPGHGQEDFLAGKKHNLAVVSPVDDGGRFTEEAGKCLVGLNVLNEGNTAVVDMLSQNGLLLKEHDYPHKYPYDWRTKKPTIFRATEQWFADVSSFKDHSMSAIDSVKWMPLSGKNRITKMVDSRGDWCISRQRSWGVPIPVFYNKVTGEPLLTEETIEHIASVFATNGGSNCWWNMSTADLLPEGELRERADEFDKGMDTMDVWFDSGTSWSGVLERPMLKDRLNFPADLYLEGSDQHRGWFQSSLLACVASRGHSPYRSVLTHGFVLDEKGEKMSKSLKNVVDPTSIIDGIPAKGKAFPAYGADTLRLWVASVDYTSDVSIGNNIIKHVSDSYRKLRNTLRYLISNLKDFDPVVDSIPQKDLASFDRFILSRLDEVIRTSEQAYENYHFNQVYTTVNQFVVRDLSNYYLDASKDRLYVPRADSFRRRSCQTVLYLMLEQLLSVMAPIVPHLAEDAWHHLPYAKAKPKSVFYNGWAPHTLDIASQQHKEGEMWTQIGLLRNDINGCLEIARKEKILGASQEAEIFIHTSDANFAQFMRECCSTTDDSVNDLRYIFMVSKVTVVDYAEDVLKNCPEYNDISAVADSKICIGVKKSGGTKCERCWYYSSDVGQHSYDCGGHIGNDICARCAVEMGCAVA